jgi:predicted RNA-binding protein YlqC (UPF0109 family)
LRKAVENLIKSLVQNPDAVEVSERSERNATVLQVRVAPDDIGKIIGREGRTIKAIRSILHAASLKAGRRYTLDIVE